MKKRKPADDSCATKYPIMLIHGIGYDDEHYGRYWGRIPAFLRERGAELYFGNQDPFGSIRENAAQIKASAERALGQSGAEKLNLIAHSKGGIEARYMITHLEMAERIASLTTVATPHQGICSMDHVKKRSKVCYKGLVAAFNAMLLADGRRKNSSLAVYEQMTADYMNIFNQLVPDMEGVYYQSYAVDMKTARSHPAMAPFYLLVKQWEGRNDGLVSAASAKWGEFRGVYAGTEGRGLSHPRAADSCRSFGEKRRDKGRGKDCGPGIAQLYEEIANHLKKLGY